MPKFTFTKHAEFASDTTVSVTFETELLSQAEEHVQGFLKAAGFELQETSEESYECLKWDDWFLNQEPDVFGNSNTF